VNIEAINPDGLCEPPEPYSYAVRAGDTVYLAVERPKSSAAYRWASVPTPDNKGAE
jgi:hypothetical protein